MTDIIASPAVKEAVKIVMEQQERLGKNAAEAVSAAATPPQPMCRARPSQSAHPYCERHNSRTKRKTMHAIASTLKAR